MDRSIIGAILERIMNDRENETVYEGIGDAELRRMNETVYEYTGEDNTEQCAICLENMNRGDMIIKIRCDHIFHSTCINRWFSRRNTCPICRDVNRRTEATTEINVLLANPNIVLMLEYGIEIRVESMWSITNTIIDLMMYVRRMNGMEGIKFMLKFQNGKIYKTTESFDELSKSLMEIGIMRSQNVSIEPIS